MQILLPDAETRATILGVQEPSRELTAREEVRGEGPVQGFRLELADIWQGI